MHFLITGKALLTTPDRICEGFDEPVSEGGQVQGLLSAWQAQPWGFVCPGNCAGGPWLTPCDSRLVSFLPPDSRKAFPFPVETTAQLGLVCDHMQVTFPVPLSSSFFFYRHGRLDFPFPPAGEKGGISACWKGSLWCDRVPLVPLAGPCHLQGAGDNLPLTHDGFSGPGSCSAFFLP